ncbi:YtxH domain-containing protein [Limibacter armeniacum]|uniref:YtxH domain-containing protein n=1 Tax=Limibacter armeniacum TaxID=466084 RepID=UPI002FE68DC8
MRNNTLFTFLGGIAVGALAGLLLAPDTGENMQRKLTDEAKRLQGDLNSQWATGREKFESYKTKLKKKQDDLGDAISDATKGSIGDA